MPEEATPPQAKPNKISTTDIITPNGPSIPSWVLHAQIADLRVEVAIIKTQLESREREREYQLKKWHVIAIVIGIIAASAIGIANLLNSWGLWPFS